MRKNRARIRARHALPLFSARREPSVHGRHRLSLVCVDHRVATMHFLAAVIFRYRTQRRCLSIHMTIRTRVNGALSKSESEKREG